MVHNAYCGCIPWEGGITLLGMMQLNAALFFWAEFATINYYYAVIAAIAAAVFTFRVIGFFLWMADDNTATRIQYYNWHWWSFIPLGMAGIAEVIMAWLEWGHVPTWTLVSWVLVFGLNVYHIFVLKDFSETSVVAKAEKDVADETLITNEQSLIKKESLASLRKRAIELLGNTLE